MGASPTEKRRALTQRLFPAGIPRLWCPPLTHYTADGGLDRERIAAHLATLAPHVKGMLVPGSTGDGWEMDDAESRELLELVLALAPRLGIQVLVGALRPDPADTRRIAADTVAWLQKRTGTSDALEAIAASRVCGVAFCPPKGEHVAQDRIRDELAATLDLGVPSALYQLPQVTQNEMAPATVAELAATFGNVYLFKDSSGGDRVATSGLALGGLCLLRGAECDYVQWPAASGGPYHGFLLSTANCFAPQLARMLACLAEGKVDQARAASELVSRVINSVFELVDDLPHGNKYTNANKAIDHYLAHGAAAAKLPPPRLHAGSRLPAVVMEATGALLAQFGLIPDRGYLHS